MLLLRAVFATALLVQGYYYLCESSPTSATWFIGLGGVALSALLFAGFLTPVAGVAVGLSAIAIGFSFFPACTRTLFESYLAMVFALTILIAIIILGPGAFSVDALLFGRREIVIPPASAPRRRSPSLLPR